MFEHVKLNPEGPGSNLAMNEIFILLSDVHALLTLPYSSKSFYLQELTRKFLPELTRLNLSFWSVKQIFQLTTSTITPRLSCQFVKLFSLIITNTLAFNAPSSTWEEDANQNISTDPIITDQLIATFNNKTLNRITKII